MKKDSNWGNYIIISFLIFIGIIASMVVVSMKQDIPLVSRDYYEKEIKYQNEIDALSRGKAFDKNVVSIVKNRNLKLEFNAVDLKEGRVEIYSPLGPQHDKSATFVGKAPVFDVKNMKSGNFKLKIFWLNNAGEEFQIIRNIYVP